MANLASARKRVRTNERRRQINRARRSRIRTFIKRVETAIEAGDQDQAREALRQAQPEIQRGVTKGVWNKRTADRKISRLSARIKALGTGSKAA